MTDCYVTAAGSTTMLTGILSQDLAEEIAVNRSAINPGHSYEVHGTNGHAGWLIATATAGKLTRPERPDALYTVVGVRAAFWAAETGRAAETVLFDRRPLDNAEDMARYISESGMDDGAVDFWHEVGGHTEVRTVDGTLVAAYIDGRRFTPEQFAARQAAL